MNKKYLIFIFVSFFSIILFSVGFLYYRNNNSTPNIQQAGSCVMNSNCLSNTDCDPGGICNIDNGEDGKCICKTNEDNLIDINTFSEAEGSLKLMTFNLLGGDAGKYCDKRKLEADIKQLDDKILNENIDIVTLQEVVKKKDVDEEGDGCKFDMRSNIISGLPGYTMKERTYMSYGGNGDKSMSVIRTMIFKNSSVSFISESFHPVNNDSLNEIGGAEFYSLDTVMGEIIIVHVHPRPKQGQAGFNEKIVQVVENLKSTNKPIFIMGDFNLQHDNPKFETILNAGFSRACDPNLFPQAGCNDTVNLATQIGDAAIDHIMMDKRSSFLVSSANVDKAFTYSDHFPVVVEIRKNIPTIIPTPIPSLRPTIIQTPRSSITISPVPSVVPSVIPSVSLVPKIIPTLVGGIDSRCDLDKSNKIDINDFALFVRTYKEDGLLVDFNNNGKGKDINDFNYFISKCYVLSIKKK